MAINVTDVADIANSTIATFDRLKISEIATTDEEHHFLPQLIDGQSVQYEGGNEIVWDALIKDSGGARNIGLFDKEQIIIRDVTAQGKVPWRRTVSPYMVDALEIAMNRTDENKIIDLVGTRRAAAYLAMSNLVETDGWGKPTSSTDTLTPFGVKGYWIVKSVAGTSASTSDGGFNGGNPTGFTAGAGNIDSSAVPTWANWAHQYTDPTQDDLVAKMRLAAHRTHFKSPIKGKFKENTRGMDKYIWYMPYLVLRDLITVAEQRSENLGFDLGGQEPTFHRNPMRAVSKLDDDSDNPVYAINWSVLYIVLLRGMALEETKMKPIAGLTETVGANIRLVWNTKCVNRRRLAVLSTAAAND